MIIRKCISLLSVTKSIYLLKVFFDTLDIFSCFHNQSTNADTFFLDFVNISSFDGKFYVIKIKFFA